MKRGAHKTGVSKNVPIESVRKNNINPAVSKNKLFKAFCKCGYMMMDTTPQDVWDGVQPRCKRKECK